MPDRMVVLPGGSFLMGSEGPDAHPEDGEGPVREVTVGPFAIDACVVSNGDFAAFVGATGYRTTAEETGWSFVFAGLLGASAIPAGSVVGARWWLAVEGACWHSPEGPGSRVDERAGHPVVHVSLRDAEAFASWRGVRLPTEVEWEYAARGGLEQARFPWGDELMPEGEHRMNVWQGEFPETNTGADGFLGTAPVNAFPANAWGIYNATGNVWEWTTSAYSMIARDGAATRRNDMSLAEDVVRVARGGSYLCHVSYCNRYRVAARIGQSVLDTTGHLGFRCAADA